jgi:hypothetical protein
MGVPMTAPNYERAQGGHLVGTRVQTRRGPGRVTGFWTDTQWWGARPHRLTWFYVALDNGGSASLQRSSFEVIPGD